MYKRHSSIIRYPELRPLVLLGLVAALLAGPVGWVSEAHADQIGVGGATGSITFKSLGGGTLSFSTTGFTALTPLATFQSPDGNPVDTGTATYGSMSGTTGAEAGGVFSILSGGTETFTYTSKTDSDKLTGTVSWQGIKDNTKTPQFDVNSILVIKSSSGDSAFTSDFPVGGRAQIDFTIKGAITLTTLAAEKVGSTSKYQFSSGETNGVPEPSSLVLFGIGLIGLGLYARRRMWTEDFEG